MNNELVLENFISFCDEMQIAEEVTFPLDEFMKGINTEKKKHVAYTYLNKINTDWKTIEEEINKASAKVYKIFKNKFENNGHYKQDCEEFYKENKSCPKVKSVIYESDYVDVLLGSQSNGDMILFYQDEVCKLLNLNTKLKSMGHKFETEDYPGIAIIPDWSHNDYK